MSEEIPLPVLWFCEECGHIHFYFQTDANYIFRVFCARHGHQTEHPKLIEAQLEDDMADDWEKILSKED